jgi:FkbH-like protein
MTLGEALGLVQQRKQAGRRRAIFLVCGFQPLHLATFLQGHFAARFEDQGADIQTGLYGDLEGTLAAAANARADATTVVIEWSDLDPRLGLRSAGGWALSAQADILQSCKERLARLIPALKALGAKMPVALVSPTLPPSLVGHTASWQASRTELELERLVSAFLSEAGELAGIHVASPAAMARVSPSNARLDPLMELRSGFPYTLAHASAVAEQAVRLMFPPSPMKGLITDLDETFWSGIVGEVGAHNVNWTLADHAAIHGLYQQMLAHLSEMGVLLAVASKNEAAVVEEALAREDLYIPGKRFFPVLANWGSKSESVAEILRVWNIGSGSVVFIDDSEMELEQVRTAFPQVTCLQFSKKHPGKVLAMLERLRDLFGKPSVGREDALRQESIRANAALEAAAGGAVNGEFGAFIRGLQGRVVFDCRKNPANKRLLELINKTNQFNLNGVRVGEGEWNQHLEDRDAVVVGVSYEDKFGPLGTIGVLSGRRAGDAVELTSWVLSCRAFSRKIEDHMLDYLFRQHGAGTVRMAFRATDRNQPLRSYLASLGMLHSEDAHAEGNGGGESAAISREEFQNRIEDLPHEVRHQSE